MKRTILRAVLIGAFLAVALCGLRATFAQARTPLAWWPGDGDGRDVAGGHDLTLVGGVAFEPGKVGLGLCFDGGDDQGLVGDPETLRLTGSLTISAWILVKSLPQGAHWGQIFFRGDNRFGRDPYQLAVTSDGNVNFHVENDTPVEANIEAPIPLGEFVHVAATLDDATGAMRLYLNGALAASATTAVRPLRDLDAEAEGGIGVGNHPGNLWRHPFHGIIDELKVYGEALSAEEVQQLAEESASLAATSPLAPPAAPSGLTISAATRQELTLTWTAGGTDATRCEIERRTGYSPFARVGTVPGGETTFTDTGLDPNILYTYRVRAVNAGGSSAYSDEMAGSARRGISFQPAVLYAKPAAGYVMPVDIDGDGRLDIAAGGAGGPSVLYGRGDGTFEPRVDYPAGDNLNGPIAADLNGDGQPDMVVLAYNGDQIGVMFNQGERAFAPPVWYHVGAYPVDAAARDFNGDGKIDLAVVNHNGHSFCVMLNRGDGTLLEPVFYEDGRFPGGALCADVNGDGKLDLVTTHLVGTKLFVHLGDGTGKFTAAHDYAVGVDAGALAVADLDGDGMPDVASSDWWGNVVHVLFGDGTGALGPAHDYPGNSHPGLMMASADFDGDGDADLVWANGGTPYFSLLENTGMDPGLLVASHDTGSVLGYALPSGNPLGAFVAPLDAGLATAAASSTAPLLVNGGFETPAVEHTLFIPSADAVPSGYGWSLPVGSIDHNGGFWQPAEGRNSIDLNGLNAATLAQEVATTAGQTYRLEFMLAGNPEGSPRVKTMDVFWRGQLAGSFSFDTTGHSLEAMGWQPRELLLTGSGGRDELKFVSTTGDGFPAYGPALDDIRLTPVAARPLAMPPGASHSLLFGPDGNLYVGDVHDHAVRRYDGVTGAFIDDFVAPGSGGLAHPGDLVFGPDGNLYVTSFFTHTVLRYDGKTGAFLDTFVPAGSGGMNGPGVLWFGPDGNLYVVSEKTDNILRFNGKTGTFLDVFVAAGSGGLHYPVGARIGADGQLYVSSYTGNTVLRYDGTTGAFLDVFVPAGSGGLAGPTKMLFGPDGNLYVVSQDNNRVIRYDGKTGAYLDTVVAEGSGGLNGPTALAFLPAGAAAGTGSSGPRMRGWFLPPLTFPSEGSDTRTIAVGDFNGDGQPDVAVGQEATSTVAVYLNNTHAAAPALRAITLNPGAVVGGETVTGEVTLDQPAGADGVPVTLGSSAPAAAQPPATVTVPAGETKAGFAVTTAVVAAELPVTITAEAGGRSGTAPLTVQPAPPSVPLTPPRGVLILAADEWPTTEWENGERFIRNVAAFLTEGKPGNLLVYSDHFAYDTWFQERLRAAGHTVTQTLTPGPLAQYDAVFIGGTREVDQAALAAYLQEGGKIYLFGGSIPGDGPGGSGIWNGLLAPVGLTMGPSTWGNWVQVSSFSDHPIFADVPWLRAAGPSAVSLLTGEWPKTRILSTQDGTNWWAIYDGRDLEPEVPFTLQLLPPTVLGGGPVEGLITLPAPAPAAGTLITLSGDNPDAATVPPSVTVPPGAVVAPFSISTREQVTSTPVTITGRAGSHTQRTATLLVAAEIPGTPQNLVVSALSQSQIVLKWSDVSAVETSFEIERRTAQTSFQHVATLEANVTGYTDPGLFGSTSYTYRVRAINAGGVSRYSNEASASTLPVTVLALELTPGTVIGGGSATGRVTLDGPAPEGGAIVSLGNDHPEVAEAPQSVTVPEGTTRTTFAVTTPAVTSVRTARLLARYGLRYGTGGKEATLRVVPGVMVTALTLSPATLEGGGTATATVTLSGAAPAGGTVVSVTSEDPAVVSVPATVTVAAGESAATFQVATEAVTVARTVMVTASDANGRAEAWLTLQAGTPVATEPPVVTEPPVDVAPAGSGVPVVTTGGEAPAPVPPTTGGTGQTPPVVTEPGAGSGVVVPPAVTPPSGTPHPTDPSDPTDPSHPSHPSDPSAAAGTPPPAESPSTPPAAPVPPPAPDTARSAGEPAAPETPARVVAAHGIAVLRPSTHEWIFRHSDGTGESLQFGGPEDLPVPADYLGLGQPQVAVFRPSTREWFIRTPEGGLIILPFGGPDDVPVPGDYLGLGRASLAVYRATTGQWFVRKDDGLALPVAFGIPGDVPVPGDYLGLGRRQFAVFQPGTAQWVIRTEEGQALTLQWGTVGDLPVWGDYLGLGRAQIAVYRPSTGEWFIRNDAGQPIIVQFGGPGDVPMPADYFGVGRLQMGVYRPSEGTWYLRTDLGETVTVPWGGVGDVPLRSGMAGR